MTTAFHWPSNVFVGRRPGVFDNVELPVAFFEAIHASDSEAELRRAFSIFARRILKADDCIVGLLSADQNWSVLDTTGGRNRSHFPGFLQAEVLDLARPIYVPDLARQADPGLIGLAHEGFSALAVAPMVKGADRVGYLTLCFRSPPVDIQRVLKVLSAMATGVCSQFLLQRKIRMLTRRSVTDPLTGAGNRRAFDDTIHEAWAYRTPGRTNLTVLMLDLDHFKRINDTLGHLAGDEVLREMVSRVQECSRIGVQIFRIGGEEFATVLPNVLLDEACSVALRHRRTISGSNFSTSEQPVRVTASFGVAQADCNDTCINDLIARCDKALYAAKQRGRDQVVAALPGGDLKTYS